MSIFEKALRQSWAPFKPTCMPHSQKLSRIPCETIESDRLALVARTRTLRPRVRRVLISAGPPSHHLDLVNGAAGFCDCGRMTIGELIEVLSELAESEDYDPASPVYLVSGNETTPRPLTDVEPDEDDDSLILIAV